MESDANYSNDSISGANALTLGHCVPGHLVATVGGTIMSPEGSNTDEDLYLLGTLSAGNVVELSMTLPSTSSLASKVTVVNTGGAPWRTGNTAHRPTPIARPRPDGEGRS